MIRVLINFTLKSQWDMVKDRHKAQDARHIKAVCIYFISKNIPGIQEKANKKGA